MRLRAALVASLASSLLLAGCLSSPTPSATTPAGPVTPAFTPPPAGTIVAGVVGAAIGFGLSAEDGRRALAAELQALSGPPLVPIIWQGSTPGVYGQVEAGPSQFIGADLECREYIHEIFTDGVREAARGTSCRTAGGQWTPVP